MKIPKSAVQKPITTLVIFIAVLVMGVFSLRNMPIDLYPEIEPPYISVFTVYPGSSATDVETNVTRPLEDNLSLVTNLKNITSTSRDGVSAITLEFEYETNLDEASNEIRDIIGRLIGFLPENIEQPTVFKFSANMIPVMMLSATANESYQALEKILDDKLINPLNRIEGVGAIGVFGGPEREIQVNVDPRLLDAYNITVEQLGMVLAAENINLPLGHVQMGRSNYPLRFTGEFTQSEQIQNILVGSFNGKPIYVRDIAEVRDTLRQLTIDERINGRLGLSMMVQKQSGANTVQVAADVHRKVQEIIPTLPPDIQIDVIFDTSEFINNAIGNLIDVLFFAILFVTLVVLFFIGRWRATIIIVLTIPISLVAAFIYLYFTGNTLNIISLSSLAIAMGMVVDDAIVVLENITNHIEKGSTPKEAAVYGTNEVGTAVVASTLTVVAVFLPMTLIGGLMGLFFTQLGWIVSITITISTLAALSLTPMLSSKLLSNYATRNISLGSGISNRLEKWLDKLDDVYTQILTWAVGRRKVVLFLSIAIFIGSIGLLPMIGTGFFPDADHSQVQIAIELPTGTRLEETVRTARAIEATIMEQFPEVSITSTSAGYSPDAGIFANPRAGSHTIDFHLGLTNPAMRERDVWEVADAIRKELGNFPEIVTFTILAEGGGPQTGAPIEIEVYGENFDITSAFALQLSDKIRDVEGTRDISISRGDEKPELRIVPDQVRMSMFGLNTSTVSQAIRNRVDGLIATRFREDGEEYNIVVRHGEEFRNSLSDIENITVRNATGQLVRIKEFATVEEYFTPPNIERKNRMRYLIVSSQLHERPLGEVSGDIQNIIDQIDVPDGVEVMFGGEIREQQEAFADLLLLLALSIFLVYVVMAAQFESFRTPFIIMTSVPFSFTGVFIALVISGSELNVISFIGAIILVGIVVKNGIVLIDYTNTLRARGRSLVASVVQAGKSRLRPVLMTTLTTILAMVPLVIATGEGSEIWAPMGVAVVGGLTFSTLITLVFVPVMYILIGAAKINNERRKTRKNLLEGIRREQF